MMDYMKMNGKDIVNWCIANGEVAWLKKINETKPTFFQMKTAFARKFMPEILPKAKEKEPTLYELIKNLPND